MTPESGQMLSHYRLVEKIGEGGMGVVWKADDTVLSRTVAIKVLPADKSRDDKRRKMFLDEAKAASSVSDARIVQVHEFGHEGDLDYIVMEYVEGEPLSDILRGKPLPPDQVADLGLQIARALAKAHRNNLLHRDLKPGNILVTPDGDVKVVDFGLATLFTRRDTTIATDLRADAPTQTLTEGQRAIAGTVPYMSPEQVRGEQLDHRSDIFSLGAVLYEMTTGQRPFPGNSNVEVAAEIQKSRSRPVHELVPTVPLDLHKSIQKALAAHPAERYQHMDDLAVDLKRLGEELKSGSSLSYEDLGKPGTTRRPWVIAATAAALGIVAVVIATAVFLKSTEQQPGQGSRQTTPGEVTHVGLPIGSTLRIDGNPLLTPDGRTAVFIAIDVDPEASDRRPAIYKRRLEADQMVKLDGSEGTIVHALSPDGQWIAFVAPVSERTSRYQLMKVPVDRSAPPLKLTDWPDGMGAPSGMSRSLVWATAGRIFGNRLRDKAIIPFSSDGGAPDAAIAIRSDMKTMWVIAHSALPGGRHVLAYYTTFESGAYRQDVGLLDSETGDLRHLIDDATHPWYAPTGHIVFSRRDDLLAAPFDLQDLEVTASAQSVLDGLWSKGFFTGGTFSVSASGDLLYGVGQVQGVNRSLAILSRDGAATSWSDDRYVFQNVWGSPDGRRLATMIDNVGQGDALLQIRVSDIDRPRLLTVGTEPGMDCDSARWATDSRSIAYLCRNQEVTAVYSARVDNTSSPRRLFEEPAASLGLVGFSAGDSSIFLRRADAGGSVQLVSVPTRPAPDSEPVLRPIPMEENDWSRARLSPDGRWLAYIVNEAGRRELFVREVQDDTSVGPGILASSEVGNWAIWSNSMSAGRYELIYLQHGRYFSLEVITEPSVRMSDPKRLDYDPFPLGIQALDTLPDGRLLIVRAPDTEMGAPELGLVLNWTQHLARQVPALGK